MNTSTLKKPAIVRIWRGRTARDRAEYEVYNEAGIKPLIKKALAIQTFREDREGLSSYVGKACANQSIFRSHL